jgi:hypothetical protein
VPRNAARHCTHPPTLNGDGADANDGPCPTRSQQRSASRPGSLLPPHPQPSACSCHPAPAGSSLPLRHCHKKQPAPTLHRCCLLLGPTPIGCRRSARMRKVLVLGPNRCVVPTPSHRQQGVPQGSLQPNSATALKKVVRMATIASSDAGITATSLDPFKLQNNRCNHLSVYTLNVVFQCQTRRHSQWQWQLRRVATMRSHWYDRLLFRSTPSAEAFHSKQRGKLRWQTAKLGWVSDCEGLTAQQLLAWPSRPQDG